MRYLVLASICVLLIASASEADTFGSGADTFDIEFVTIGGPGNSSDTMGILKPTGKVDYIYRMGKYEVSEQMIDKANALGDLGITKVTRGPDKPVTNVSWNESARFVNWLNTSQGFSPAYKFALHPGDVGYNSNSDIQPWTPDNVGYDASNLFRNSLAKYFLPSVHEWHKAAYYNPINSVYHKYPTGSNSVPIPVDSGTLAGTAVYNQPFSTSPANITQAGGLSPYGTMGQGGNVYEWEETDLELNNALGSSPRGVRGGDLYGSEVFLRSSFPRASVEPNEEGFNVGFRVASIPEPSTLILLLSAFACRLRWRRS